MKGKDYKEKKIEQQLLNQLAWFCPLGVSNTLNPAFDQGYANIFLKYSKTDKQTGIPRGKGWFILESW